MVPWSPSRPLQASRGGGIVLCSLVVLALLMGSCKKDSTPVGPSSSGGGKITAGASVDAGSMMIGTGGGTFTVSQPGTGIHGMRITVPRNAYTSGRTFQVSYAPIVSHQLPPNITLLSPLITISNGGVYGSLLSTPIVNPPQSGILGMHAIQDRPVARDGQVVIRPMMYLALSYDHRIIDGRIAVQFLKRIKELVEDPEELLLET